MALRQLERKTGDRARSWWLWPMRAFVLIGTFLLCWWLIYGQLPFFAGVALGGAVAALAILGEILLTAKIRRQSLVRIISWRLLFIDRLLTGPDALANQRQTDEFSGKQQNPLEMLLRSGREQEKAPAREPSSPNTESDEDIIEVTARERERPDSTHPRQEDAQA